MEEEYKDALEKVFKEIKELRKELQEVRGIILGIASGDLDFK